MAAARMHIALKTPMPSNFLRASSVATEEAYDRVDTEKATTVLLGAQVCNDNGEYLPIVLYRGVHYLIPSYIAYALNSMSNSSEGLNFYVKISETVDRRIRPNAYRQVVPEVMQLVYGQRRCRRPFADHSRRDQTC